MKVIDKSGKGSSSRRRTNVLSPIWSPWKCLRHPSMAMTQSRSATMCMCWFPKLPSMSPCSATAGWFGEGQQSKKRNGSVLQNGWCQASSQAVLHHRPPCQLRSGPFICWQGNLSHKSCWSLCSWPVTRQDLIHDQVFFLIRLVLFLNIFQASSPLSNIIWNHSKVMEIQSQSSTNEAMLCLCWTSHHTRLAWNWLACEVTWRGLAAGRAAVCPWMSKLRKSVNRGSPDNWF